MEYWYECYGEVFNDNTDQWEDCGFEGDVEAHEEETFRPDGYGNPRGSVSYILTCPRCGSEEEIESDD